MTASTSAPDTDDASWAGDFLRANLDLWRRASAEPSGLFVDLECGGIFAGPATASAPASQIKGDAWKLDYHTLGLCLELMAAA